MSTTIDQKTYLQKYLGGPSASKKKKKKKATKGKGFKIIDDDIDLTKLRPLDGDELDILDDGEDGPQVAGIIDERPEDVKKLEQFATSSKWKVVTQDDGFNSKLQIEEIKKDIKDVEKENEIVFGKMYSDSEDEKNDNSDPSPPRSRQNEKSNNRDSKKKQQNNSDSDFSPPRKGRQPSPTRRKESRESDFSPPRKGRQPSPTRRKESRESDFSPRKGRQPSPTRRKESRESDFSPPRKGRQPSPTRKKEPRETPRTRKELPQHSKDNRNYDSDLSPPRKTEGHKKERIRKPSRWGDFEESSQRSESPKKSKKRNENNSTKYRKDSIDSDASPPRKRKGEKETGNRRKRGDSSDSDISPPRKRKSTDRYNGKNEERYKNDRQTEKNSNRRNPQSKEASDSDLSPPRKNRRKSESPPRKTQDKRKKRDSSSDLSPPRKEKRDKYKRSDDSPPPSNKKMEKTLDGKMAGLQNARQLRDENQAFRRREEDAFKMMTDEVSGRNAKVVSRKAKRETSEDRQKLKEKAERQKELDEKYKKWSRGLKQIEDAKERMASFAHEAAKPLARMRGDRDLEAALKRTERAGDPMLRYVQDKRRERGDAGPEKPIYKGNFPPNRFNIRPGYRWDGVDRSNGYERKFFENQSKRKAQEEEAYKWSTEDL